MPWTRTTTPVRRPGPAFDLRDGKPPGYSGLRAQKRDPPMTGNAQTIRRGRKFTQVLEGARQVFMADGFEGASVDDIARTAGVSKATLYSYFPDKRLLFMEVATVECNRQADMALREMNVAGPPSEVLRTAGLSMATFFLSDFGQQVFRMSVAEAARFPELGQKFYYSGPALLHDELVDYLKAATARGQLDIEDFDLAAFQFPELCKADLFPKLVFGLQSRFSSAEITRIIDGAVEMFLARYGTGK